MPLITQSIKNRVDTVEETHKVGLKWDQEHGNGSIGLSIPNIR